MHPALAAEAADRVQVVAVAGRVLDEAEANQARAAVEGRAEVVEHQAAGATGDGADLDAAGREVQPRVAVRGVLVLRGHQVVAGPPRVALGDDADALARILDEGEVE